MTTNSGRKPARFLTASSLLLLLLGISSNSRTMAQSTAPTLAQTPAPAVAGQSSPAPLQSPVQVGSPEPSQTPSTEPTKAPVTPPPTQTTPDCFTNTTDLFDIIELASPFVDKEYILCPNTVFDIGFNNEETGECCERGQMAIYVKSKMHVKCGESGASSNNCIIRGGDFQLVLGSHVFEESITTEVKFSGITWEASTNAGMILGSQGDITFVDNIIRHQMNRGPIVAFFTPPFEDEARNLRELFKSLPDTPRGRAEYFMQNPQLVEDWMHHSVASAERARESGMVLDYEGRARTTSGAIGDRKRRLQPEFAQVIDFINCQFYNNSQGRIDSTTQQGIITALTEYCPTTFENCTFTDNRYTGVENRIDGYLVKTGGSPLTISNSCVYNNNLTGFGAFQQYGNGTIVAKNNYAAQNGYSDYFCQFVAVSGVPLPDNPDQITCVDGELESCPLIPSAAAPWMFSLWVMLLPTVVQLFFV